MIFVNTMCFLIFKNLFLFFQTMPVEWGHDESWGRTYEGTMALRLPMLATGMGAA